MLELGSTPPRPGSVRELRREEILDAAEGLVVAGGLEGLTVAALEGRLTYTRGVITYHFAGKDEIVFALLERAVERIDRNADRKVKESARGRGRLGAAVRAMVDGFLSEGAACAILFAFWSRLQHDPAAREINALLYAGYRQRSERLLAELAPRLSERRRKALATLLVGQVIGIVTQAYFEPGAIDLEASVREAGRALEAALA
ncbi:MAG: TetR/AcrR family transcriptional regulator [Deltaproteobacteria bacterium]|nr:TetR/AcrR family transcriptional regulator [Deltaproteobacteria bacterium]